MTQNATDTLPTPDMIAVPSNVLVGDCLQRLKELPDNSVDAVITDPPYGMSDLTPAQVAGVIAAWVSGDTAAAPTGRGFMGKSWDAFVPPPAVWAECLRVLKPGGHLAAFASPRTQDLMGLSIRLAGFEIRDCASWVFGSGFPKSMDVSKAIDKAAGAQREVVGTQRVSPKGVTGAEDRTDVAAGSYGGAPRDVPVLGDPVTPDAQAWVGHGTALKPAHEPIVLARKPLAGTVAANVLEHGTGSLNIDGTRVAGTKGDGNWAGKTTQVGYDGGWDSTTKPNTEQNTQGRWPANLLVTHTADCTQTGTRTEPLLTATGGAANTDKGGAGFTLPTPNTTPTETPVWECAPGCPANELDAQSGTRPSVGRAAGTPMRSTGGVYGTFEGVAQTRAHKPDTGGASRFFPTLNWDPALDDLTPFLYTPKPSRRERDAGLDHLTPATSGEATGRVDDSPGTDSPRAGAGRNGGARNTHPTVKPVAVMSWLIKLLAGNRPEGHPAVILDPFLGSGTTAFAAILEGVDWIGCEYTPEYLPIIAGRIAHAQATAEQQRHLATAVPDQAEDRAIPIQPELPFDTSQEN